jgi:hypothetical protein
MAFEGLVPVADVSVGDWLQPRMCGFGGRVCSVVPTVGFEAFARVLHPAGDAEGPVRWSEVCDRLGRTAHALMQWGAISGTRQHVTTTGRWPRRHEVSTTTSEWPGAEPAMGDVPVPTLARLLDVLADHTAEDDCFHALWEGYGWLDGRGVAYLVARGTTPVPAPPAPQPALPPEVLTGPRFRLPERNYLLFRGPLRAALAVGDDHGGWVSDDGEPWFSPQSPNLIWPADRSWCVATEIDFDSTLVAGSRALVDAVLAHPDLEAWEVRSRDDLTDMGDRINR